MEEPKIYTEDELKVVALNELTAVSTLETEVNELQLALQQNPQFTRFLELQSAVAKKNAEVRTNLFAQMVNNSIKSITLNDWGKITVVETITAKVSEINKVNKKYILTKLSPEDRDKLEKELGHSLKVGTKVADQVGLNQQYKLTEKLPAGTEHNISSYLKLTPKKIKG